MTDVPKAHSGFAVVPESRADFAVWRALEIAGKVRAEKTPGTNNLWSFTGDQQLVAAIRVAFEAP